ncbi:helix-turn-helix domain-containing protein [Peribacillus muralis]|uniref:helix-turn-helix domain-containing protein n=1 Tax=Peribacillus muralis TaxID=264697 RepID=UPI00366C1F8D
MLIYQSKHFEAFSTLHPINQNFPSHLHRCFELIFVVDGEVEVIVNKRCLHLKTGEFLLILPYEIHSIITKSQSRTEICIFSPDYVPAFRSMIENSYLENPIFNLSLETKTLIFRTLFKDSPHLIEKKAVLYLLLSELLGQTTLIKAEKKDQELIHSILSYIQEHFTEAISLKNIATALGYSYNYLSKYFNENIGESFVDFLNGNRISYACYLLSNTEKNITEIAYLSGYENTRSFNRNFVKIKSCTPKEYREKGSNAKEFDRAIESTLTVQ